MIIRTYSELSRLNTFEERIKYLQLKGTVGKDTFGFDRIFNQQFYTSTEWRRIRNHVIARDNGCDLGVEGHEIGEWQDKNGIWHREPIFIHHMNPITITDIKEATEYLLEPEYLVLCTKRTHDIIHYGRPEDLDWLNGMSAERCKNDTCPWKH